MKKYINEFLILEFLDDSYSNSDDMVRRPILPKNLNVKHGMTKYKMKLEEKKKQEKLIKISEKIHFDKSKDLNSPKKWRSDTENTRNCFNFILIYF